ncbi:hypothetical protein R4K54_00130 [Brachyspira murdochii]|uniref:hypothetical protein n=1 Tax=Brachyspira murdochii TaxID=84378 RepID=UPI00300632CA
MIKKLFVFSLVLLSVLGCTNGALKPKDFSKETIDEKYPYWQVGIERFEIMENVGKYTTIKVNEKRYTLRCMALIRTAVNSEEFVNSVKAKEAQLVSSISDNYAGQSIKPNDKYDPQKLIDCIRSLKYDFIYRKMNTGGGTGAVGKSRYLRYGLQPDSQIPTGNWVGFANGNWDSGVPLYGFESWPYASWASLMFHEHMHNIGFNHFNGNDVPTTLQIVLYELMKRILYGDLKNKYYKQLEELTAYYYTEYKDLLNEDIIFDPNVK